MFPAYYLGFIEPHKTRVRKNSYQKKNKFFQKKIMPEYVLLQYAHKCADNKFAKIRIKAETINSFICRIFENRAFRLIFLNLYYALQINMLSQSSKNIIKTAFLPITALAVIALLYFFISKNSSGELVEETNDFEVVNYDLKEIKKRGKLKVLTEINSTGYFLSNGEPKGFEYEMIRRFASSIGVEAHVIVVKDRDSAFFMLNKGKADILAMNLAVTGDRLQKADFSEPFFTTRQILVQKKPEGWRGMKTSEQEKKLIRNPLYLKEKTVFAKRNSSALLRLKHLSDEIGGIKIEELPSGISAKEILSKIEQGEIDYVIMDENLALSLISNFSNLDINTTLSFNQQVAWAVRKSSPELLSALNQWIKVSDTQKAYKFLFNKYYKNKGNPLGHGDYQAITISAYDHYIKKHSKEIKWDWRLVAAIISNESGFNPDAESGKGAKGLMQLMPNTFAYFLTDSAEVTPEASIRAGTKYLARQDKFWKRYVFDKEERLKFVLASYNVGPGHVLDARRLAIKNDLNPNKWDNNVEICLKQKGIPEFYNDPCVKHGICRGDEPVRFVKKVLTKYEHYKNLVPKE
jgi:membrane-bound lytic murein transglycosylase F